MFNEMTLDFALDKDDAANEKQTNWNFSNCKDLKDYKLSTYLINTIADTWKIAITSKERPLKEAWLFE